MGLCSSCLNQAIDVDERTLHTHPTMHLQEFQKTRTLLADLEVDFKEFAGDDGVLDASELGEIWKKCAERKVGKLSDNDRQLIEKSSKDYFNNLDVLKDGKVTYEEFVAYMLGAHEARGPLQDMRSQLAASLKNDPKTIHRLVKNFKKWDKDGDGFVTPEELDEHLAEMQAELEETSDGTSTEKLQGKMEKLKQIKEAIFREADVDHDGRVDMWEVMAHMLGRRKIPVEILLYDISKGMASKMGKLLIGKKVAALHSGLLIFGSEYWYGGQIFRSNPPCSKAFGDPLLCPWDTPLPMSEQRPDLPVVKVGYTFVTHAEFTAFLKKEVTHKYRDLSQYDLLTHSCHHFTDECIKFLTGTSIPDKIMELQRMAMTPAMMAMRPALNRYLGGFGDAGKSLDDNYFTIDTEPDTQRSASEAAVFKDIFESGEVVLVKGVSGAAGQDVVATILSQVDGKCDIKYFDAAAGDMKTASGVKASQIRPVSD